jgi:hypothetical protein
VEFDEIQIWIGPLQSSRVDAERGRVSIYVDGRRHEVEAETLSPFELPKLVDPRIRHPLHAGLESLLSERLTAAFLRLQTGEDVAGVRVWRLFSSYELGWVAVMPHAALCSLLADVLEPRVGLSPAQSIARHGEFIDALIEATEGDPIDWPEDDDVDWGAALDRIPSLPDPIQQLRAVAEAVEALDPRPDYVLAVGTLD